MSARKPKFAGIKTKWEKKRISRRFARLQQINQAGIKKKPLAEPLAIAPLKERQEALKEGKMVFYDGKKRISLNLVRTTKLVQATTGKIFLEPIRTIIRKGFLQGVYKLSDGRLIAARIVPVSFYECMRFATLKQNRLGEWHERYFATSFVSQGIELGHMSLSPFLRRRGIALKFASKGERNLRAAQKGRHSFTTDPRFMKMFEKLHYRINPEEKPEGNFPVIAKRGKHVPKDNLFRFHRIEAIDPKTGKASIFTFPIKAQDAG